jgi:hypothetical protein
MEKRIKYRVTLVISFVAGLAIYCLLFHSSWCTATRLKDATIKISSKDLLVNFDQSEASFDREYLTKVLSVRGVVEKVKKDERDHYTLYLGKDPEKGPSIACSLDSLYDHSPLMLRPGDDITLRGTCVGRLTDIILIQCIIEKY